MEAGSFSACEGGQARESLANSKSNTIEVKGNHSFESNLSAGFDEPLDDTTGAGWRHIMVFFQLFFAFEGSVASYSNFIGFGCNAVNSKSDWVDNEWISILGWTIPLILIPVKSCK